MKKNAGRVILFLAFFMLLSITVSAQVNVVTTVSTDPASTGSINICSGQTHVVTTFTNQSGSALTGIVVHQVFPAGMTPHSTVFQNGCNITWDAVASTYALDLPNATPCSIDILADISCAVQPDPATNQLTITNTSSTHTITPSPNMANFSVTAPQLGIIDFFDDRTPQQSIPLPVNGAAQQLVIFKDAGAPQLVRFRQFDIKVTDGVADNFTLTLSSSNPALASEVEIQHTSYFELQGIDATGQPVNPVHQYPYTYTNPTPPAPALAQIHVDQNVIHDLFGSTHDELQTLERIRVFEYFYVVACSPATEDGTIYTVDWACSNQGSQPCSTAVENRTIHVEASKSWVGMTVTIDPPFEICTSGTSATSNLIYKFTNPLNTGRPKGSGTKTLHTITIPINDSWLTPGYAVYLRDVNSTSPGVDVSLLPGFYDNTNGVITLDFDVLGADPFNGAGDALRDDFIKDNKFNEFGENEAFELILKDVKFLCNSGQFYLSNNTFSSCEKTGNEVMLDGTATNYYHPVEYDDMCDASIPIRNLAHTYANYFPVTSFVEADKTDVHSGDPFVAVDLYYQYTGWVDPANISPFKFLYPPGPLDDIINCNNNVTYRAVVSLSPLYFIHNTNYYPDPNSNIFTVVTLNPIGSDPVISGNQLYEITGLDKNGKINLNLELNLDPLVCLLNTGGEDVFTFSLEAICDGCTTCAYVFACQEQILHHHCQGECSGPPQSTGRGFKFDRSTFGWTTSAMTTAANASTSGVRLNRTYPCDIITVKSPGSIAHINTGFQKATTLSYFIEYDSPQANSYQFFSFEGGTLEYTPKDGSLQTLTLTSADVDVNSDLADNDCRVWDQILQQYVHAPCSLKVDFNFPPGVLSDLQDTGAVFNLEMNLSVKPMMSISNNSPISWPDPGYYLIPQVRGQYISDMGNSCDDYGDNMMTMNLGVSETNEILTDGHSGYSAGLCGKYFMYQTTVTGGLKGLDDFPSEFRPIMKWPEWNASNPIKLELPSSGLNTFYQLSSANFTYDGNLYPVSTSGGTGPVITFDGYVDNGVTKPWPVIENDGKPTKMEIYGRITNECPVPFGTAPQQVPTYKVYFPYEYRAYTSGIPNADAACSFNNPEPDQLPYKVSETYSLYLQREDAIINIYSSVSTINNLKLNLVHEEFGNMYVDHTWLHFNETGYQVTAVRVNNVAVQSDVITVAGNPWVFWKLGTINEIYTYDISIDLVLTSCAPNTPLTVEAETGFNCFDYPTNANPTSACSPTYTQSFTIVPQNSKINLNVTGPSPNTGTICNTFLYTAKITSSLPGDVEDPVLEVTLPSGLSIASTTFKLNGTGTAISITPVLVSGKWTYYLNPAAFNNSGIPGNNAVFIELFILIKGNCNMAGQASGTITFHAAGKNICLTPISDEDDDDEYLTFDPRTVVTNSINNQICSGSSIQLTAPSGPNYLWSNGMTTQSISVSVTGTYTVTVSDCCPLSVTTFNVTVYQNPAAAITGGNVSCNGSAVTLTSSSGTSYAWSTGATTQSIQTSTAGTYTVTVTDTHGCTGTKSKTITSGTTPTVSISPNGPTLFCDGGSVLLTSTAGASYLWSTGATTQSIYAFTQATYIVTMTNAAGCTASSSMSTTVLPNPPVTVSANGPTTFCEGGSVILTSSSSNQYLWTTGETTQSITVTTSGSYMVTGTNAYGCLSSSGWVAVTVENCNEEVGFCMHVEKLNTLDYGREVMETDDGGYAIAAGLFDEECDRDLYFLKYDPQSAMDINCLLGDLQKGCVGSYMDEAHSVVQRNETVNGNIEKYYYIAGSVFLSQTNHDIVVAKIAENGIPVWSYRFRSNSGTDRIEEGMKIIDLYPLCSDHLLIVGYTNSYEEDPAKYDMFALQMRSNGTIAQFKTFGNAGTSEKAYDAVLLNNNEGCIIAGEIKTGSNSDVMAIKVNGKIDKQADLVVHGESDEVAYAVTASNDHVYLAGKTNTFGQGGGYDVYLIETDYSLSTISSTNTYGQRDVNEVAYDLIMAEGGNLVMTGAVEKDDDDGLILKTSTAGVLAWSVKTSFENHDDKYYSITEMSNTDLIATGYYTVGGHDDDIFISKITAEGNSCCMTPYAMENGNGGSYENTGSEWTRPLSRASYNNYQTYYEEDILCGEQEEGLRLKGKQLESSYHLYPNPAHASVTFSASPDLNLTDATVTLYDVLGKAVGSYPMFSGHSITIGLEQFPPGIYLLRFTDKGMQLFQSKLVKN